MTGPTAPGDRIRITCPACGASALAPLAAVGRSVKCSRCQHVFRAQAPVTAVPGVVEAPVAAAASAPAPTQAESAPGPTLRGPVVAVDTDWPVGEVVLGLYEVTGVLGQGGMGRVYRVHHRGWGVDLAVKAPLRRALEAAGGAEAFEREAETWVGLGLHPHVVSCYYVRRIDGIPRVFAEYVDGGSLHQAIKGRTLATPAAALDVAIQFAWGLHYAHEQGLVHRDVKPGNVLLSSDGTAKVTDFGLAGARVAVAAQETGFGEHTTMAPGGGGGTPAYMSPEQWAGQPLTRRTDVWSWAVSVLELFLGRREWELGPAAAVALERCLGGQADWALRLPPEGVELLRRCLHEDLEQRPRTLAEAADALAAAYASAAGSPYPRARPAAGRDTADSLNNRAVSMLDLGRGGAEGLWEKALRAEAQHAEASYNHALHAWTAGRLGDADLVGRVEAAQRANAGSARAGELLAQARAAVEGAAAVEERALKLDGAFALAITPSTPRVVALAKGAAEVRVWRATGEPARPLVIEELKPRVVVALPDGRSVLLAGEAAPPQVWDVETARSSRTLARFPGITYAAALTADGRLAVLGGSDRVVRVLDMESGRVVRALEGHAEAVSAVAVDAQGAVAASGGLDGTVHVWDLATGALRHSVPAHRGRVAALALSRDGAALFSGGDDRAVAHVDAARGGVARTFLGPSGPISALLLLDDGRELLVASHDRSLRTWDLSTGTLRAVARAAAPVAALAPGRSTLWMAGGPGLRELRLPPSAWRPQYAVSRPLSVSEVAGRDAAFLQRLAQAREAVTQGDLARALTLAREARSVPGHERSQEALTLWDEVTAQLPHAALSAAWQAATLEGHRDPVVSVAVSADGLRAASGDLAGGLRWWDLRQRSALGALDAHEATVSALALGTDGRTAVTASWDRTLKVWDLEQRRVQRVLGGHSDYVNGVSLSPSGRSILSASSDLTLRVWDQASGRELGVLEGHEAAVSSCAFGPDGRFAVSASWDGSVRLWDVETRTAVAVLLGHEKGVAAVAISRDGLQAASGGIDGVIQVWDLRHRRQLRELRGHTAEITTLAFLPDGRHLVSAGRDKSVRVWNLSTSATVRTLPHAGAVLSAAALPSGNGLLCGGTDMALSLWRLDWEADAQAARETLVPAAAATMRAEPVEAWEEIRRAAPRAAARGAAVHVARTARRRLPRARAVAVAAVIMLAIVGAVAIVWPRKAELGLSEHQSIIAREDLLHDVVGLAGRGGECADGDFQHYLEKARERVVSEDTLGCLLRFGQPDVVDAYLRELRFDDSEPLLAARQWRNAVSFLADLGDPAVPFLCNWLRAEQEVSRRVAVRALSAHGRASAVECITNAAADPDPSTRRVAAEGLRLLVGRGSLDAPTAWALAQPLAADPDAGVRRAAVALLAMFDFDHATAGLARLAQDGDQAVAAEANRQVQFLRNYKNLNPDRPY